MLSTKDGFKNFGRNILWILEDLGGKTRDNNTPRQDSYDGTNVRSGGGGVGWWRILLKLEIYIHFFF